MREEVWKAVVGYEGLYSVSNLGRVRRDAGGKGATRGAILKQQVRVDNRRSVTLYRISRKGITVLVHRLVAEAFIGPCPPGKEVNHIDTDTTNNGDDNLEYLTHAGNVAHSQKLGRLYKSLSVADAGEAQRLYDAGASIASIARRFCVSERCINLRLNRHRPWRQLTEDEVRSIKGLLAVGLTQREIGRRFRVHYVTIHYIASGKTWKQVV